MMGDFNFDNAVENENITKLSSNYNYYILEKMILLLMFGLNCMI